MLAQKILPSLAAVSLLSISLGLPVMSKSSRPVKETTTVQIKGDESAVRAQLAVLRNCVNNGDAKTMASLWTEAGRYIDDEGSQFVGHAALEKTFIDVFQQSGKPQVEIVADSIRFPAKNVALVEGIVKRKDGVNLIPSSRHSMVFEKQNGLWLISSATETSILNREQAVKPLQDLQWLIGNWSADRKDAAVNLKVEWTPDHNFICCKYEVKKPNETPQTETQIIGWDPINQRPVSWMFDASGGFGQGTWTKQKNQWIVETAGVERNGSLTDSTNLYNALDANNFSWQSVNRHVNGVAVADLVPLKVQRVIK
ncbi:MAG: nuclear transport factor 2 family protein [Candidatus Obscuribacterales bacterium]|nr:nuclear transport factor 2 family protein [Candidatus Obscuribacterales bacterium]